MKATQVLKNKIIFTIFALIFCRIGSFVPIPIVDIDKISKSIYKYSTAVSGHFSIETVLNKMLTNSKYCYNGTLQNPFSGLIKYSGALNLMSDSDL